MTVPTQGKLADKPLGELIRELGEARLSGALRLSRDRAKAVVYVENGAPIFAASNLRAHRLAEFLKRSGIVTDDSLADAKDEEVLDGLLKQGKIKSEQVASIRANHVTDILRGILLWIEGDWQFDQRVRVGADTRVAVEIGRLLLEATRHLPLTYIASRFRDMNEQLQPAQSNGSSQKLPPVEASVASRLNRPMTIAELQEASGLGEEETLRAVYGLAISGAIRRGAWTAPHTNRKVQPEVAAEPTVEEFVARVSKATDHYDVLGVSKQAEGSDIKSAYHDLARRYHPDRFHQAEAALRAKIESAFARIARANEILGNPTTRAGYDMQLSSEPATTKAPEPAAPTPTQSATATVSERATASFQKGVAATNQKQLAQATRFFAEAASLEPRCARYRAEYGRALINDPQTRRIAEIELKAAIALEPANASYRVVLAELYLALGLRRRAEGELQRAMVADPNNEEVRALLARLKK